MEFRFHVITVEKKRLKKFGGLKNLPHLCSRLCWKQVWQSINHEKVFWEKVPKRFGG